MSSAQRRWRRSRAWGIAPLARWSERLLEDCNIVQRVIDALDDAGAIDTVNRRNTDVGVAAGGFEGVTNPSFVFTVRDSGRRARARPTSTSSTMRSATC